MSQFYKIGGAIIAAADRDSANFDLLIQGLGPNNFSVPLESTESPGTIVNYGCYMPMDAAIYSAINMVVEKYGGEWVLPTVEAQASARTEIDFKLRLIRFLRQVLKLRIKR